MNKIAITINSIDYSRKVVYAPKMANLLDERLDEANIFLRGVKKAEPFTPLDIVNLTIDNYPEAKIFDTKPSVSGITQTLGEDGRLRQVQTTQFLVANDAVENYPVGSEFYNHTLYFIEITKWLERYVCDSLYFSNSRSVSYTIRNYGAALNIKQVNSNERIGASSNIGALKRGASDDTYLDFFPLSTFQNDSGLTESEKLDIARTLDDSTPLEATITITSPQGNSAVYSNNNTLGGKILIGIDEPPRFYLSPNDIFGIWHLEYYYEGGVVIRFYISVVKDETAPKKWTVAAACTRCFELALPLRDSLTPNGNDYELTINNPRFILDGASYDGHDISYSGLAAELDKIYLPSNFALTRSTLREQLQQIGKIIHAEPRVKNVNKVNGIPHFTIGFDFYGEMEYSKISRKPYISTQSGQDIENYATAIDSSVSNFVSTISWAEGVAHEPYSDGEITLRTETVTARITDDEETIIPTTKPIQEIEAVYCRPVTACSGESPTAWASQKYNITDYIFEDADYNNLSSYDGYYPYSKAFALRYTQGERNIKGLFFKVENEISPVFEKYSIWNILDDVITDPNDKPVAQNYEAWQFEIVYKPIFGERLKQYKPETGGNGSTLIYNQSSNVTETAYYGENLKGAIARLGNVEKAYTYKVAYLTDIPKAGQLFDDDYYISAVSVEINTTFFRVTLALSKDYNRLSEYVGISSIKRMYEVSEKQSVNRDSVYCETLLLDDDQNAVGDKNTLGKINVLANIGRLFFASWNVGQIGTASMATAWFTDEDGDNITPYAVNLPVISTAFGNAMTFTFSFEDNYSAGQKSSEESAGARWGQYVAYGDYFGRAYGLNFDIKTGKSANDFVGMSLQEIANLLPQQPHITPNYNYSLVSTAYYGSNNEFVESLPIVYRKIGEEIPSSITYQLNLRYKSGGKKYIIGSGFARNCPLVSPDITSSNLRVYFLSKKIPKFAQKIHEGYVEGSTELSLDNNIISNVISNGVLKFNTVNVASGCVAWCVALPEDSDGYHEIIFACNETLSNGTLTLPTIRIIKEEE